jgi:ABC-2 type transport system permease protein
MRELLGIYTIWYRDLLRFWRDKLRLMGSFIFPLLFLVVFGAGLGSRMGQLGDSGVDLTQFMFPGIIGMTVLMSSFMAGVSVVWDREFGFLKEVLVAPINRASVAIGKALGAATIATIQGMIILVLAPVVQVPITLLTALSLIPLMILLSLSMGSLGILLATRIRSMEAFQVVMQLLMFPMAFLSGVFFPLQGLPTWMSVLVKINPATYGISPIRQVMLGDTTGPLYTVTLFGHDMTLWNNVIVIALFGVIMIVLAMWSFQNQE